MARPIIDLLGQTFGRLVVVGRGEYIKGKHARWVCKCDCGAIKTTTSNHLRSGRTKSCGCFCSESSRERIKSLKPATVHGLSGTPEFRILMGAISRCHNSASKSYADYGGNGVVVCDEWRFGQEGKRGIEFFIEHIGRRPSAKHTLDRIDPSGDYAPGNVRWLLRSLQNRNKRGTRYISLKGERMAVVVAAKRFCVPLSRITERLDRGWSAEDAIFKPPRKVNYVYPSGATRKQLAP